MAFTASPRIGLGTSQLGAHGTRDDAYALLDAFMDLGGTLIDTAAVYSDWIPGERGRAETVLGEWLGRRGNRAKLRISTKGGHPPLNDMAHGRLDAGSLRHDVEQSLRRLQTDHIDLYLLHRDDTSVPVPEIFGVLGEFVSQGKLGAVGVSNWNVSRIAQARMLSTAPVANQVLGNILCLKMNPPADTTIRVLSRNYVQQAASEDLALMLFASQCRGLFLPAKHGKPLPPDYDNAACRTAIAEIEACADDAGLDPGDVVLASLLHLSRNVIPLIGPQSVAQLTQSMRALDVRLDTATVARLARISAFDTLL